MANSQTMKIVVTGAGGQLGWELCRQWGVSAVPLDRARLDVTNRASVFDVLSELRPAAVINTAAYTAVDRAEQEPDAARQANADAVGYLADACEQLDCVLLQLSTDYVFGAPCESHRPWHEEDPVCAQGVYAQTKLAGEQAARGWAKHFVVRTCGLYGAAPPGKKPNNFVETMLRLGRERDSLRIVNDQFCTPSSVVDVARAIRFLITTSAYGTYHVVDMGSTNWIQFAAEIFRQAKISIRLEPITTAEYGAPAPRPSFSVLDCKKYRALGGPAMPDWREALADYLGARRDLGVD